MAELHRDADGEVRSHRGEANECMPLDGGSLESTR